MAKDHGPSVKDDKQYRLEAGGTKAQKAAAGRKGGKQSSYLRGCRPLTP